MPEPAPAAFFRLFLAIPVPPEVSDVIARAQARLRREAPPGTVRWAAPDQFHVTVEFLGDVPSGQVADVAKSVAPICAASPALQLSARGIGFFPNPRRPKVIWVGAHDADRRLPALHRDLDAALRWLAPAERTETFTGHITLGRFKPGQHAAIPQITAACLDFRDQHFGEWRANELQLFRSELTSVRAEHSVRASFFFAEMAA